MQNDNNNQLPARTDGGGGGGKVPGWLITIGILILLNILSAIFDWNLIFY